VEDLKKVNKQLWASGLQQFAEEKLRKQDPPGSGLQEAERGLDWILQFQVIQR
jgi:hypothetical protein